MSDTRGLLDRISAFRQRLDATPQLIPEAIPVDANGAMPTSSQHEAFRYSLNRIADVGVADEPMPQFTDRAQKLLAQAKKFLDQQRAFSNDPLFADCAEADSLAAYHRQTVAVLDSVVRQVQAFPNSASVQLKMCEGLSGLLCVVQDRLAVQERTLAQRRTEADRIDRLAGFFTALHHNLPATLQTVATLAEEILEDARRAKPLRYAHVDANSFRSHAGAAEFPAPARYIAAHAINVAQVVARLIPYDYEWAARPLAPVVGALLMDCGMMNLAPEKLAKAETLTPDERRVLESHPKLGAELLLWRFPNLSGPLAAAIATHHERSDGTGYPTGARSAQIPPMGRLLRVADVYAALNEERPYRPANDPRAALTEVLLMAEHGQVDRDFAEYLLNLSFYPVNTVVELTDGRTGVVVANHANRIDPRSPGRPVIEILADAEGVLLPRTEHVDLSAADRGSIVRALNAKERNDRLGARYPDLV